MLSSANADVMRAWRMRGTAAEEVLLAVTLGRCISRDISNPD
jgi:hypothetical protein